MSATAPIDIELQLEASASTDESVSIHVDETAAGHEIVVIDEPAATPLALRDDAAMTFVYLGVLSFITIVVAAALLAL